MRKVVKDIPLLELTVRRYEKPQQLDTRELLKKYCLSIGLLQPGDSRDIIIDILHVLLQARREQEELCSEEIRKRATILRRENALPEAGVAGSNIRRQLKRLRDLLLVQKIRNNYRITEFSSLSEIFDEKIEKYMLESIVSRVKEYHSAIDEEFSKDTTQG